MSLESYHYKGEDAAIFPTDEPGKNKLNNE